MWVAASPREGCTKTFNWERWIGYFSVHDDCQNIISALRKRIASLSTLICWNTSVYLNIAKGTTDPRVHYLDQTWAQRLNQMSASKSWRNFSLEGLTKIQLQSFWSDLKLQSQNLDQKFTFKILTKLKLQNLNQISCLILQSQEHEIVCISLNCLSGKTPSDNRKRKIVHSSSKLVHVKKQTFPP